MHHASRRLSNFLLVFVLLLLGCSACGSGISTFTATPTPIPGGEDCVKLDQHAQAGYSHVAILDHYVGFAANLLGGLVVLDGRQRTACRTSRSPTSTGRVGPRC